MKFPALRRYVKSKNISSGHVLKNCDLVIDGDSYFKDTYKASGCQFILGPDCDRYAEFIIKKLRSFLENDVKCYVIFSGDTKLEIDKRKEIHQIIIDKRNRVEEDLGNAVYFQPLFVIDVQKQVLEEMDIKYFVCEHDSTEAIVSVARKLKCPVLTNNIEYSLFRVSCIPVNHEKNDEELICKIYDQEEVRKAIGVYDKMPILLCLLYESGDYRPLENFKKIIEWEQSDGDAITPIKRWIRRQRETGLISKISKHFDNEDQNKAFKEVHERIEKLYLYPTCNLAVKYFKRDTPHGLFRDDKNWFAKGVSDGRIGAPYINLKNEGFLCGSAIMNDSTRPDALLAAFQIIAYGHCLLSNSQSSTIKFFGRKDRIGKDRYEDWRRKEENNKNCSSREISTQWDEKISNRDIFTKYRVGKKLKLVTGEPDAFKMFLKEVLPGYDSNKPLQTVPEECWIVIITLVYYIHKKNQNFINGAYCFLLSYLMLGPVSKEIDCLKTGQEHVGPCSVL